MRLIRPKGKQHRSHEKWPGSDSYQVDGDASTQQEAQVDVDGVVLVLDDPGQAADDATNDEEEDQQGLQQLGRVW